MAHFNELAEKIILESLKKGDTDEKNYVLSYKIAKNWKSIVGTEIYKMVVLKEILNDVNHKKCIVLKLLNQGYAVEVRMYKRLIQERVNAHLGKNIISDVLIRSE